MNKQPSYEKSPFDSSYFSTGPYAKVSFDRFSQYWWSNRFYALLAKRHGPPRGRVLEIGCGLGHLLGWFTDHYKVFGSDINTWALSRARRNVPHGHFVLLSAGDLQPFPDRTFQIIIVKHVVEHLSHPEQAISEMARVLGVGGVLILVTPNLASLMRGIKKDAWVGYKDPTHISLKPPAEWLGVLRTNGLRVKCVFSDGFWDAPYLPIIPKIIQKLFFGAPGGLQAILGWGIIPLRMGESLIVIAERL